MTVKLNPDPTVAVALLALVKAGPVPTTTVMVPVASGSIPLLAVIWRFVDPAVVGVPDRVAVPLPLSVNVRPSGSGPGLRDLRRGRAGRGDRDRHPPGSG